MRNTNWFWVAVAVGCSAVLAAPAATWVVDDLCYTNGVVVECHTIGWAMDGAVTNTSEANTISIVTDNPVVYGITKTFASFLTIDSDNREANLSAQTFLQGGSLEGLHMAGATFAPGASQESRIENCTISADLDCGSNHVEVSQSQFTYAGGRVINMGVGSSFNNNAATGLTITAAGGTFMGNTFAGNDRLDVRGQATITGNAFLNGGVYATRANLDNNTFASADGDRTTIYLERGSLANNTFSGPTVPWIEIGHNLYLVNIPRMELRVSGSSNTVTDCGIEQGLGVGGGSNIITYCTVRDGRTTNGSIVVAGAGHVFEENTFVNSGGFVATGDGLRFNHNLIFSNAYGVTVWGNGCEIQRNWIGLSPQAVVTPFSGHGLAVYGDDNTIGGHGPSIEDGNHLLGGSGMGIVALGNLNVLRGNQVGLVSNALTGWITNGFGSHGIFVANGVSNVLNGEVVGGCGGDGIVVTNSPWTQVAFCRVGVASSNVVAGNAGHGIRVEAGPHLDLWDNWVLGSGQSGARLVAVSQSEIVGNCFGFAPEIGAYASNALHGIHLVNSTNVAIGHWATELQNVVAGHGGHGIYATHDEGRTPTNPCGDLVIRGNWIGHYEDVAHPNAGDGIRLEECAGGSIGGTNLFDGNAVGANGGSGIRLSRCTRLTLYNNLIGMYFTPSGAILMPNQDGIRTDALTASIIGGGHRNQPNYVAGNRGNGILLGYEYYGGSHSNVIQGNYVGVDSTGMFALTNGGDGLRIVGDDNLVGGGTNVWSAGGYREGNILSGNASNGLFLGGSGNLVVGNLIGCDDTGTGPLGNKGNGIYCQGGQNFIGDPVLGGNVISANDYNGIMNGSGNRIQNNFIGLGLAGEGALGNGYCGIYLTGYNGYNTIGGTNANEGNYIANHPFYGIYLDDCENHTTIAGNWLGFLPAGMDGDANGSGAIYVEGPTNSWATANTIRRNILDGPTGVNLQRTRDQVVEDNWIGFDPYSARVSTTMYWGVYVREGAGNRIGGDLGNRIGGTRQAGIYLENSASTWQSYNRVYSNLVGVATNLGGVVTNRGDGIVLVNCRQDVVGDRHHPNWVANGRVGIKSNGGCSNDISGNCIGRSPFRPGAAPGNASHGIEIENSVGENIGLTDSSILDDAGNVIVGSQGHGVYVFNSQRISLENNFIGLDPAVNAAQPNALDGVHIAIAEDCYVGLHMVGEVRVIRGNVISGNRGHGVYASSSSNIWVSGNCIGTGTNGSTPVGNGGDGVCLVQALDSTVGSGYDECYEDGYNVIGGNASNGIHILEMNGAKGADIQGNFIGTDARSQASLTNGGCGILVENSGGNRIGYEHGLCGNTIVNSGSHGIAIVGPQAEANEIVGNWIGIPTNSWPMGNHGHGIYLTNTPLTVIGGAPAAGNRISDNDACGILAVAASGTVVRGNFIGTGANGTSARSNGQDGLRAENSPDLVVGGVADQHGNVLAHNGGHGLRLVECPRALLQGNAVGVSLAASAALGNFAAGILLSNCTTCVIIDNAVGDNGGPGIQLSGPSCDLASIRSNLVGVADDGATDLGNAGDGIHLRGGDRNQVCDNRVAFNGGFGVVVYTGARNLVRDTLLYLNALQSIHVATNEPANPSQPNEGIRPPRITSATVGSTRLQGTVNGSPLANYTLEVVYASYTNQSGAQARHILGHTNVTTDAGGAATFDVAFATSLPHGTWMAASMTDTNNNTSELSAPVRLVNPLVPAAPAGVHAVWLGPTLIRVCWTAAANATGYMVYRNTANNPDAATAVGTTADTCYLDTVAAGASYYYWVSATNQHGASVIGGSGALAGHNDQTPWLFLLMLQ